MNLDALRRRKANLEHLIFQMEQEIVEMEIEIDELEYEISEAEEQEWLMEVIELD